MKPRKPKQYDSIYEEAAAYTRRMFPKREKKKFGVFFLTVFLALTGVTFTVNILNPIFHLKIHWFVFLLWYTAGNMIIAQALGVMAFYLKVYNVPYNKFIQLRLLTYQRMGMLLRHYRARARENVVVKDGYFKNQEPFICYMELDTEIKDGKEIPEIRSESGTVISTELVKPTELKANLKKVISGSEKSIRVITEGGQNLSWQNPWYFPKSVLEGTRAIWQHQGHDSIEVGNGTLCERCIYLEIPKGHTLSNVVYTFDLLHNGSIVARNLSGKKSTEREEILVIPLSGVPKVKNNGKGYAIRLSYDITIQKELPEPVIMTVNGKKVA